VFRKIHVADFLHSAFHISHFVKTPKGAVSLFTVVSFVVAALEVEQKDNPATQSEVGWLRNESFVTTVKTDSFRYSTFVVFSTLILCKLISVCSYCNQIISIMFLSPLYLKKLLFTVLIA